MGFGVPLIMYKYIIIDIGGTAIKYGLMDERERLLESSSIPTEADKGGEAIQKKAFMIISDYLSGKNGGSIVGVAISTAGVVDPIKGMIVHSGPTIPGYKGIEFKAPIPERFKIPCEIENDVNCAGLAEYISGAGKGSDSMLCLTIGTGIGGCFVSEGKILRGNVGCGCEVGYMSLQGSPFEKLGAASILSRRVAEAKSESEEKWNGIRIFEAARDGDKDCIRSINRMCAVLGEGIANICYVPNPETVVLGGGIMAQSEYLIPIIRKEMHAHLIPYIAENTSLKAALKGNTAGMTGAFYHFRAMRQRGK